MRRACWGVLVMSAGLAQVQAAPLTLTFSDAAGQPLAEAVVTLGGAAPAPSAGPATAVMDQIGRSFQPRVLAVRAGTAVSFPNHDDIRHQVYSFSPAKRFELDLYHGTPSDPVRFDKPGLVVLGCNIHDWMVGYIYVTDTPWFAVSDAQGRVTLEVPPGAYQVSLWHPGNPDLRPIDEGSLNVPAGGLEQRYTLQVGPVPSGTEPPEHDRDGFGEAFRKVQP